MAGTGIGMGLGWYGPLIDLCAAASYVGEFVQLLVFIHRSTPHYVQYKSARLSRTDIDVGDETRPFFCISIFNHHLASAVTAGGILFFRNVKLIKYGSMVEARSVEYTSVLRLIHPDAILSQGVDELANSCPLVVGTAKDKLRKVMHWVHHRHRHTTTLAITSDSPAPTNWRVHRKQKPTHCFLLSHLLHLSAPCKAIFYASVAQAHVLCNHHDSQRQSVLLSIHLLRTKPEMIVQHLICTGCLLCGFPLSSHSTTPLHCPNSSNRPHTVGFIYRPFLLYVWDKSEYIPLLVTNKAAEVLFGNIIAEKVYESYRSQKDDRNLKNCLNAQSQQMKTPDERIVEERRISYKSSGSELGGTTAKDDTKSLNLYLIWLIVLKMLLLQGKNSGLRFEVYVNPCLALEDGRFEMISVSMPNTISKISETK